MAGTTGVSIVERLRARGLLELVEQIAKAHAVTRTDLLGRTKTKSVATARRAVYERLREMGLSYPEIGKLLGRCHTSVMSGCKPPRKA